ncbi:MAG TPA: serine hydrolase [Rubricoccaceae bacterium]
MSVPRWLRPFSAAVLVVLLVVSPPAQAQSGPPGRVDPALADALDQALLGFAARYGVEGVSAAVVLPDGGVWVGADGYSTAEEPVEPDMAFGIGSATKTVTAALLLRLDEQGLVDLDASVETYLPWLSAYPNIPGSVTLRQLLAHRSGIFNYTNNPDIQAVLWADPGHIVTPDELLSLVGPPLFAPGTRWSYSNTNFYLAGLVAETVKGASVPEVYAASFFEPLGMTHTRFGWEPVPDGQRWAHGWGTLSDGTDIDLTTLSPNSNFSAAFSSGGLVSTAEEQARWAAALFGGDVVRPASLTEMTTLSTFTSSFPGGRAVGYGLGCFALELGGERVWAHSGRIAGYSGSMGYNPARRVGLAVLTNRSGSGNPDAMLAELHRVVVLNPVAAEDTPETASGIELHEVGPNPTTANVTARFAVPSGSSARIEVLDALGRKVRVLDLGGAREGEAEVNMSGLAPGVYAVRLVAGAEAAVRFVTVTR